MVAPTRLTIADDLSALGTRNLHRNENQGCHEEILRRKEKTFNLVTKTSKKVQKQPKTPMNAQENGLFGNQNSVLLRRNVSRCCCIP